MTTPPGWYPDPERPGQQRWWDGYQWAQPAAQLAGAPAQQRSGTNPLIIVLIIFGVLLVLSVGGCVACGALVKTGSDAVNRSLKRSQNAHSVTNAQIRDLEAGTRLDVVTARFGPPKRTQEFGSGQFNRTCIYYNLRGGNFGDDWQLCFNGRGPTATLDSKNRY